MTNIATHTDSTNWQIYRRLKQALNLRLRRQVFLAVCDDLGWRDRLAHQLVTAINKNAATSPWFITLELPGSDPHLWGTISQWLKQHNLSTHATPHQPLPKFQILGVEYLTRQPASVQWLFLSYLRDIEEHLSLLESGLLLWIPRPWLSSIQQSAPEFWQWCTGVFEFNGEPTPVSYYETKTPNKKIIINDNTNDQLVTEKILSHPLSVQNLTEKTQFISSIEKPKVSITESLQSNITLTSKSLEAHPKLVRLIDLVSTTCSHQLTNLEADFSVPETLEYIGQLSVWQAAPETLAAAYQSLGNYYFDRLLNTPQTTALIAEFEIAIIAYEQTLFYLDELTQKTPTKAPTNKKASLLVQYPEIWEKLGMIYWQKCQRLSKLSSSANQSQNAGQICAGLELSAHYYQQSLAVIDSKNNPNDYAKIAKNLGAVYADLARYQDTPTNLQQSVLAYQAALLHLDPNLVSEYVAIHNNLGTTYWHLAQHSQPLLHLQQAIASYQEALVFLTPNQEPLHYAMLQNNLATAYWNMAQYQPSAHLLEKAIECYQTALQYRTPTVAPQQSAATHNNLGTAYWHLANQLRHDPPARTINLKKAIESYQIAINISKSGTSAPPSQTFDLLATQNNLGLAHYQLATDPDCEIEPNQKIGHLKDALQYFIPVVPQSLLDITPNKGENNHKSPMIQTALSYIVKIVRAFHAQAGIEGQNLALSLIPAHLLPEIMRRL